MAIDIPAVQHALKAEGLDGWLLFDFHGSNPIAGRLAGLTDGTHMTTRRWFYLIPAAGDPRGVVHAIERYNLDRLPGEKIVYAGRDQLEAALTGLLAGMSTVAMEYSPDCAIPYLSRLDAGTAESIRRRGVTIRSSGDLVQQFEAAWDERQLALHRLASEALYRIKDRAFAAVTEALENRAPVTEFELQRQMARWFEDERLETDSPPVVAIGANAGDPHYLPTSERHRPIVPDEVLLLDLWGKRKDAGAVFADITWVGFTGRAIPRSAGEAFRAIVEARDTAVALVEEAAQSGRDLRGWEIDQAARGVLIRAGYEDHILHRTGHSLGEHVHGNGVHLDDFETHDDRRVLPGAGFTIEPGLYFETFGVRTEINMYRSSRAALVTGPRQMEIMRLVE
jgi:Xaa-Pro aminopeptidase